MGRLTALGPAACLAVASTVALTAGPAVASADGGGSTPSPSPSLSSSPSSAESAPVTWGIAPSGTSGPGERSAFEYAVDPGASITDVVGISNYTESPLTLDVYASDAVESTGGGFDLLPAAERPTGVGAWVSLDETTVTVPARSRVDLPFRLAVPDDATPGDHAGGIVASVTSEAADGVGGQLAVDRRVGARIYLRVSGTLDPDLTVSAVAASFEGWPTGLPGTVRVDYIVRNDGNLRLAGRPSVRVAGPFGLGARTVAGEPLPELLPGDSVTASVVVPSVWPLGRLAASVEVRPESSGDQLLDPPPRPGTASTHAWAVPWIPLALLAAAVAAIVILRRRRRARANSTPQS